MQWITKRYVALVQHTLVMFPILFLIGHMLRSSLFEQSQQHRYPINQWDVFFEFFQYHRMISLLLIPIFLFVAAKHISDRFTNYELIRYGSYFRWMLYTSISFMSFPFFLCTNFLLASIILSIGVPLQYGWSVFATSALYGHFKGVLNTLSQSFSSPLWALLCSILLFFFTVWTIYATVSLLYVWLQAKNKVLLACSLWWILISVVCDCDSFPKWTKIFNVVQWLSSYNNCPPSIQFIQILGWISCIFIIYGFADGNIVRRHYEKRRTKLSSNEIKPNGSIFPQ